MIPHSLFKIYRPRELPNQYAFFENVFIITFYKHSFSRTEPRRWDPRREHWLAAVIGADQCIDLRTMGLDAARATDPSLPDKFVGFPNELLMRIFELACPLPDTVFATRVSHVSRRFRGVALHLPRLWSSIHQDQPEDQVDAYVLRSKAAPLTVTYIESWLATNLCHVVTDNLHRIEQLVSCVYSRWRERPCYGLLCALEDLMTANGQQCVEMPRLTFLDMWYKHSPNFESTLRLSAPRLVVLNLKNIVPSIDCTSLTHLTYEVDDAVWSPDPFIRLLGRLPCLDVLDLRVLSLPPTSLRADLTVVTASKFRLIINTARTTNLNRVFRVLTFPRLQKLTLRVLRGACMETLVEMDQSRCPRLRSLNISFGQGSHLARMQGATGALRCYPQIHHLVLTGSCSDKSLYMPLFGPYLPSLRTLVLSKCFFSASYVLLLVRRLLERPVDILEEVVLVDDCHCRSSFVEPTDPYFSIYKVVVELLGSRLVVKTGREWFHDKRRRWL